MEAMTQQKNREPRPIDKLANLLVDDILGASDDEILAEFRADGGDPERYVVEMRARFEKSVIWNNKTRLAAAKAAVAADKRRRAQHSASVIDIASARRRLREVLMRTDLPQPLTLAARKESDLSDADILGLVADLEELGILPPEDGNTEGR
jgi:hypothetical protein